MSIHDYFQIKDGLPDPKGSLSVRLPSQAIVRLSSSSILAVPLGSSRGVTVIRKYTRIHIYIHVINRVSVYKYIQGFN